MNIKKFFPVLSIIAIFSFFLVTQMILTGQGSDASLSSEHKKLYSLFESQYSKLTLKTTDGELLDLKGFKKPIVIINFWASWCRPCISEFKSLNKLIDKYGQKIKVIGINNDTEDAASKIKKIEKEYNLKFSSVLDQDGVNASRFNITKIPASIVFHDGKVIHYANKEFDFMSESFINIIEKLKI